MKAFISIEENSLGYPRRTRALLCFASLGNAASQKSKKDKSMPSFSSTSIAVPGFGQLFKEISLQGFQL